MDDEKDNSEIETMKNQKNDFLLDNFFKIYDREPEPKADETEVMTQKAGELRKNRSVMSSQQLSEKGSQQKRLKQKRGSDAGAKLRHSEQLAEEVENPVYKRRLRLNEVNLIMDYLSKRDKDPEGYDRIDGFLKKLDFFTKYNKDIRR